MNDQKPVQPQVTSKETAPSVTPQKPDEGKKHRGLWIAGIAIASAAIGLLIYAESRTEAEPVPAASEEEETESAPLLLEVEDQPAGMEVAVSSIDIEAPGAWVVVHEVREGELGNALGATRVRDAVTGLSIPLLRATLPGEEYAVVLYRNNDEPSFALEGASVYVDLETGERVEARFETLP